MGAPPNSSDERRIGNKKGDSIYAEVLYDKTVFEISTSYLPAITGLGHLLQAHYI